MVILAVNENPAELRKLTKLLLSVLPGCIVYEYVNPRDALRCLRTHEVELVFLDLPGASGLPVLQELRRQCSHVPIITCAWDDAQLEDAMWNGATGYLVYPLTPGQLRETLGVRAGREG